MNEEKMVELIDVALGGLSEVEWIDNFVDYLVVSLVSGQQFKITITQEA